MRTDGLGLKGVELLPAIPTDTKGPDRGRHLADRARESGPPLPSGRAYQLQPVSQTLPAVEEDKYGYDADPDRLCDDCKQDKGPDANEAYDRHGDQAPGAADQEPEQGAEDLSAVQGIDGQEVEDQQTHIYKGHPSQ